MDYSNYINGIQQQFKETAGWDQLDPPTQLPKISGGVLILAPHPDDECLMAALPLRLKKEQGITVFVAAYSLGSRPDRQSARDQELNESCKRLGFHRIPGVINQLDSLVKIIEQHQIALLISPHSNDGHQTHIATHDLCLAVMTALGKQNKTIHWAHTEYWATISFNANFKPQCLLVSLTADDVITIGKALMAHQGEITRNPFHLRLPSFYQEQVRRGSEIMNYGDQAPHYVFGQIYAWIE